MHLNQKYVCKPETEYVRKPETEYVRKRGLKF